MVQARAITQEEVELLKAHGKKIRGRLESVLLRAEEGKTAAEIAVILQINPRTVEKHHQRYFKEGLAAFEFKKPGLKAGVPRYTTLEAEKALFTELQEKAAQGDLLKAAQIKPLYEQRIGRALGKSTIYKILIRNRWSKKKPRPRHPKGNDEAKEDFIAQHPPGGKTAGKDSKYC